MGRGYGRRAAGRAVAELQSRFGRYGLRLHELARGIDPSPVVADRPVRSISAEDTFAEDIPLAAAEAAIRRLAEKVGLRRAGSAAFREPSCSSLKPPGSRRSRAA